MHKKEKKLQKKIMKVVGKRSRSLVHNFLYTCEKEKEKFIDNIGWREEQKNIWGDLWVQEVFLKDFSVPILWISRWTILVILKDDFYS